MTVLNLVDDVRAGADSVEAVYAGDTLLWPFGPELLLWNQTRIGAKSTVGTLGDDVLLPGNPVRNTRVSIAGGRCISSTMNLDAVRLPSAGGSTSMTSRVNLGPNSALAFNMRSLVANNFPQDDKIEARSTSANFMAFAGHLLQLPDGYEYRQLASSGVYQNVATMTLTLPGALHSPDSILIFSCHMATLNPTFVAADGELVSDDGVSGTDGFGTHTSRVATFWRKGGSNSFSVTTNTSGTRGFGLLEFYIP